MNKGKSDFFNKILNIEILLKKYTPHILILNEANLHANDDISPFRFPDYNMEIDNLVKTNDKAHTVMLIHNMINYTRINKKEYPLISTIWIKIHIKGQKDFFCTGNL